MAGPGHEGLQRHSRAKYKYPNILQKLRHTGCQCLVLKKFHTPTVPSVYAWYSLKWCVLLHIKIAHGNCPPYLHGRWNINVESLWCYLCTNIKITVMCCTCHFTVRNQIIFLPWYRHIDIGDGEHFAYLEIIFSPPLLWTERKPWLL